MKLISTTCIVMSITAGCSSNTLEVRHGPQAIHPAEYVNGSLARPVAAPILVEQAPAQPATSAPIQTIASTVHNDDSCGASQYQYLVGQYTGALADVDLPKNSRNFGQNDKTLTYDPTRLLIEHTGGSVLDILENKSTIARVSCG